MTAQGPLDEIPKAVQRYYGNSWKSFAEAWNLLYISGFWVRGPEKNGMAEIPNLALVEEKADQRLTSLLHPAPRARERATSHDGNKNGPERIEF